MKSRWVNTCAWVSALSISRRWTSCRFSVFAIQSQAQVAAQEPFLEQTRVALQ